MHRALLIRDILLDIFIHCSPVTILDSSRHKADLAALARTCQTFKEPALVVLWEILFNFSPLVRCLPEACRFDGRSYSFSRSLSDAECNIVRRYARYVRCIQVIPGVRRNLLVPHQVPFTEPLFPNLQSLFWKDLESLPVEHIAVPSLTSLSLGTDRPSDPLTTEILDSIGGCCPNIRRFSASFASSGSLDGIISRQLCQWTSLQRVDCRRVTLSMDSILYLPSLSTLNRLSFTLSANLGNHTTHPGSVSVLSNLVDLEIESTSLKSVTTLFSRIRLPKINDLEVSVSEYTPRRCFREYWTTVQRACPSNTLSRLVFISTFDDEVETLHSPDEQSRPSLTLVDLLPYKDFGNLRKITIDVPWSVNLTDADLLDLVSTSPHLEELDINRRHGWNMDSEGGITLSGLVQLLQQCPSLDGASLVIDTRTFTQIPHGLDMSFLPRESLCLDCLDSDFSPEFYIGFHSDFPPELYMDFKSVFAALRLNIWSSFLLDLRFSSSEDSEDSDTGDESDDA